MEENNTPDLGAVPHKFNLETFARASKSMIATNEKAYQGFRHSFQNRVSNVRDYTPEEINRIVESGDLNEKQKLSRNYFNKDGYYKQIILYYATLLKYAGLLIPNPSIGKNLSTPHIQKRYYSAMDYIDKMSLPDFCANCAVEALINGSYYGVRLDAGKNVFAVANLPSEFCVTRFKDVNGNNIIEFDTKYFNSIIDTESRKTALAAYPKVISKAYKNWIAGKSPTSVVMIPSDIGICFPLFDGRPIFLSVIPATVSYDNAVEVAEERELEEIRKIIVQKIPHLSDGRLLFEPDEAEEIHKGTVGMMKGNKNVSVLTTYADVEVATSKASADRTENTLDRMEKNIYAQAGVTGQIFASATGQGLNLSLKNDLALMMHFVGKISTFVTNLLNEQFANSNITFKYSIMPISYFNDTDFADMTFKQVGLGYSAILPALALGINQKDLVNIKDLENDVLKLGDRLKPLASSYTQSANTNKGEDEDEGGRPGKNPEDKTDGTAIKDESIEKTGGS